MDLQRSKSMLKYKSSFYVRRNENERTADNSVTI
jgi:hypothetical protein